MKVPTKVAALTKATGEVGRYNFSLLHFEEDGKRGLGVATDGNVLVSASWPTTGLEIRDVDAESLEKFAKIAKISKSEDFELPEAAKTTAPFPPFRQISVPYRQINLEAGIFTSGDLSLDRSAVVVRVDLDALAIAVEAMQALMKTKGRSKEPTKVDLFVPVVAGRLLEIRGVQGDLHATSAVGTKTVSPEEICAKAFSDVSVPTLLESDLAVEDSTSGLASSVTESSAIELSVEQELLAFSKGEAPDETNS